MRLIDADSLRLPPEDIGSRMAVAYAPTAYDMDKVIEELNYIEMKWQKSCPPPNEYGEPMCDMDCVKCQIRRCIDVVKRGGVDE